jgi:hypothetical protein
MVIERRLRDAFASLNTAFPADAVDSGLRAYPSDDNSPGRSRLEVLPEVGVAV